MSNKYQNFKRGLLEPKEDEAITRLLIRRTIEDQNRKRWTKELERRHQVHRSLSKDDNTLRFRRGILLLAACLLAIVLGLSFWPKNKSVQSLAHSYLVESLFPNSLIIKGESSMDDLRQQIADQYNLKRYDNVIALSQQILEQQSEQAEDLFFLGLSYLYQGEQSAAAIPHLEKVIQLKSRFVKESQWFLVLAYIETNQNISARNILEEIVSKEQWPGKDAQILLDLLKK